MLIEQVLEAEKGESKGERALDTILKLFAKHHPLQGKLEPQATPAQPIREQAREQLQF